MRAIQIGLIASLYCILVLVVFARDYRKLEFLTMLSCGVFATVVVMGLWAKERMPLATIQIAVAWLGLILVWTAASVLAPL